KGSSPEKPFHWRDVKKDGETMNSLRAPVLVEVNGNLFAVAEAQCNEAQDTVFTGIASQLLKKTADNQREEVLKDAKDTQVLEEGGSTEGKKVNVSRPTAVVDEGNIYMLVGKHSHEAAGTCQAETEKIKSGILLVKGEVSSEADNKQIHWKETDGVPCTLGDQHNSLSQLIGGGGSGVKMNDSTLVFPVEGLKELDGNKKTVSLIIHNSADTKSWKLSKEVPYDGCSDPSVVEWEKGKLIMMTACDDGRRRVYESGDKGDSWTEAIGTLSRVWGNKKGNEKGVRSGFITAKIEDRDVMLVTLPVYPEKAGNKETGNGKGELHLWLTDDTHIVDIGPVSGEDDAAASSLLYKIGNNNEEELIALYEKKKVDAEKPSPGMVSVILSAQLQRVKDVLATWKKVDERVSNLCLSFNVEKDTSSGTAMPTNGLVGFLSGNFSNDTWRDEYLGVNATVKKKERATEDADGVQFHGAWAEWPVGEQGENQLYHFANYKFTLVATVSIDGVPEGDTSIPLLGATMNDGDNNKVLLGLSYNGGGKWELSCGGGTNSQEHNSAWETEKTYQVAIVLHNGTQGSAYVDGQRVGDASCELQNTKDKGISHFYIGGDGNSAGSQEGVSVTVRNVLLYNRPLTEEEVGAINPNKDPITAPVTENAPGNMLQSPAKPQPLEEELLTANIGGSDGVSSAASTATTPSSDVDPTVATGSEDTMLGNGLSQPTEVSVSSGEDGETAGRTDGQKREEIHAQDRELNAKALSSSLGNVSQGNNSDAGTVRESGLLPSLLLLGLWVFAAL
ncbi:trans-sialidase, partial [Trypanosoma cruzi]